VRKPQLQIPFLRLLLPVLAVALAAAFFSNGAPSTSDRASATGPFILNGVAEANLTADLTPNDVHSLCRFRMATTGTTANVRAMCYVVTKGGGLVDVNEDGGVTSADDLANAELNGTDQVDIIDGAVDVNEDAAVNTSDDLSNVVLNLSPSGTDQVDIIDGRVDVDENAAINGADLLSNVVLDLVPSGTDQVDIVEAAPPAPPPPPYSALLPIVNLQLLSGTIGQIDGSTILNFAPVLCLGVDTQDDPDDLPDAGLTVTLSTTASKSGAMGASSVVLNFDKGVVDGDPFDCDQVDQTTTTGFTPTNLAMNHDSDTWAAGMTGADGCTTWEELGTNALQGGERDPFNFWDFMDQWIGGAKDRAISGGDIGAVVSRFGSAGSPTGDPLVPPVATTGYHVSADRDGSIPGGFAWDLKPPNGSVSGGDIGAVVSQFGHSCTAAPN
jgi:hypothetical protein